MTVPAERRRAAADYLIKNSALAKIPPAVAIYDINSGRLYQDFEARLKARRWSSGEWILLQTLLFLLDIGLFAPTLRQIFYGLDAESRTTVLKAIRLLTITGKA